MTVAYMAVWVNDLAETAGDHAASTAAAATAERTRSALPSCGPATVSARAGTRRGLGMLGGMPWSCRVSLGVTGSRPCPQQ